MGEVWQGVTDAVRLLLAGDREVVEVTLRSLWVSGLALALALALGVPLGGLLAALEFPGRRLAVAAVNTGMAAPPVVVGLLVVLALTRNGPLGGLRLLFTGQAMVVAQTLIALPVVTGLVLAALQQVDPGLRQQLAALGAGRLQTLLLLLREVRVALLAAVMAAFGAVISEVGAVMMVGGNIRGQTQVLTTAIVQETRSGRYAAAIALAVVLMALAFAANLALTVLQQRGRRRTG